MTSTPAQHRGARLARRLLSGVAALVVAVVVAGPAHAVWTASGSGAGSSTAATNVAVTLSPATPAANLFPGGQANVVLTVSNPNTSTVHLTSLSLDTTRGTGGFSVDAGHAGCAVNVLSLTTQTNGGAGWNVPAKAGSVNGTLTVTLTNALSMGINAANACQGATTTIYLTAV